MFESAAPLDVAPDQKRELERLLRNGNSPPKVALRCKVLLLAHEGVPHHAIAGKLNISNDSGAAQGLYEGRPEGSHWHSKAETVAQSADTGTGAAGSRYYAEDASWGREHALERAQASGSPARFQDDRA